MEPRSLKSRGVPYFTANNSKGIKGIKEIGEAMIPLAVEGWAVKRCHTF